MSASKRCKELGAPSLRWVSEYSGKSESALYSLYGRNPKFFDIVVLGSACHAMNGELKRTIMAAMDFM